MKGLISLGLALGLLVLGSGCQENWESFFIIDNKRPGDPPECAVPTAQTAEGLLGGTMDTSRTYGYVAYLFVENALIARADQGLPRAESNGIFVEGAYLYYEPDPQCPGVYPDLEARVSQYIDPGGQATIGIWIIPGSIGRLMAAQVYDDPTTSAYDPPCGKGFLDVTVTVQFFGITQSGSEMLTQEFDYPITVCSGCLLYAPPGTDGTCTDTTPAVGDLPCNPGQDDLIDYRLFCEDTGP
ncbi:MAG: hypothetical protein HY905_23840 [Deltaproteobacteria bacterium]|nr:hypothetical protein [Deltaproteobacteria bacterium]